MATSPDLKAPDTYVPAGSTTESVLLNRVHIHSGDDLVKHRSQRRRSSQEELSMQRVTSSNWPHLAWAMFLAGLLIRSQPEMGMEKYAWKTGGNLYYPASTFSPRHYKQGLRNSIISITTRSQIRSSTVMSNYYAVPCSDVIMFWNQYPTVLWHFPATK